LYIKPSILDRDERQALPSNSEPNVEAKKPQKPLDIAKSTQYAISNTKFIKEYLAHHMYAVLHRIYWLSAKYNLV